MGSMNRGVTVRRWFALAGLMMALTTACSTVGHVAGAEPAKRASSVVKGTSSVSGVSLLPYLRLRPVFRYSPAAGSPWWKQSGVNCELPAMVRVGSQVVGVGARAGMLLVPPESVWLRVGRQIEVHVLLPARCSPSAKL
jgi:hypothetical protein